MRRPRGAALASLLTMAALLIVVALAIAMVSLHSLHVAQGFHDGVQGELLARAAAEEFIARFQGNAATGNGVDGEGSVDFLEYYRKNAVFPDGGQHLGGEAAITFDSTLPYYSVDNSQSDLPAASWADRGTARTSVPPYSVSLVVRVKTGQQTQHYEFILQRRWPYAAALPHTLTLTGLPEFPGSKDPGDPSKGATTVKGPVFCFGLPITQNGPNGAIVPRAPRGFRGTAMVPLDPDMYEEVAFHSNWIQGGLGVTVGRSADPPQPKTGPPRRVRYPGDAPPYPSTGNLLDGRVDFADWDKGVVVFDGNEWKGTARQGVITEDELEKLGPKIFRLPSTSGYQRVDGGYGLVPVMADLDNDGVEEKQDFLLMADDVVFHGTPGTGGARVGSNSKFHVRTSMGNRYLPLVIDEESGEIWCLNGKASTGTNLDLKDCVLVVEGSLDLSGSTSDEGRRRDFYGLRGDNATLIVKGTLILTKGVLNAGDRGMVIYCERLVMQASGSYRGLILVEEGALIYPSVSAGGENALRIDGGIICGGERFSVAKFVPPPPPQPVASPSPSASPTPEPSPSPPPHSVLEETQDVSGLRLWTTKLEYNPRFLKTIHQFGDFHMLTARKLP